MAREGRLLRLFVSKDDEYSIAKRIRQEYDRTIKTDEPFRALRLQLDRYLKGERIAFDVETDISGLTSFTGKVLDAVKKIPYGETRSYKWIAEQVGKEHATRAIGQAVKRNPVPLIIPCHRVIRNDGSVGGFSMEGVSKEYLLSLEGVTVKKF